MIITIEYKGKIFASDFGNNPDIELMVRSFKASLENILKHEPTSN